MFEILKNNKKLMAVHIVAAVIVVGLVIVCVYLFRENINHNNAADRDTNCDFDSRCKSCMFDLALSKNNLEECEWNNRIISSTISGLKKGLTEAAEKNGQSLYTCLGQYDNIPNLPDDIQKADVQERADYIIKNNLYVIACDRLWRGDKNLSGTSTLVVPNTGVGSEEWFRYNRDGKLFIVPMMGAVGYGAHGYFEINLDDNMSKYVETDVFQKCGVYNSEFSADKRYCVAGGLGTDNKVIEVYDWLSSKLLKSITLSADETSDLCWDGYDFTWIDNNTVEVKVYQAPVGDTQVCKQLRTITIKI